MEFLNKEGEWKVPELEDGFEAESQWKDKDCAIYMYHYLLCALWLFSQAINQICFNSYR